MNETQTQSWLRRGLRAGLALTLLVGLSAADETAKRKDGVTPPEDVKLGTLPQSEYMRNSDGTVTWFYLTNHIGATQLGKNVSNILKGQGVKVLPVEGEDWTFAWDDARKRTRAAHPTRKAVKDENLLVLNFKPALRPVVTEILKRFDRPTPQVFLKAKVVEVTLDKNKEFGTSIFFDRGTATTGNPNTFFRSSRTAFRPPSFTEPFNSVGNTGLSLSFEDVTMDEGTLTLEIEALEEKGVANILSQPAIMAMQGQFVTLGTLQRTPVNDVQIVGSTERIVTRFENTGIRLDMTPMHIGREYVKLRVRTEVSSVTSFITVQGGSTTTQAPVIAERSAETVVTVRDGMTLVIGGLYSVSDIESRSSIPILGDIPLLKWLFSRSRKTQVKSELDFYITPYILRRRLDRAVFVPPMERERLKKAREKKKGG